MSKLDIKMSVSSARAFEANPAGTIIIGENNQFADFIRDANLMEAFAAQYSPDRYLEEHGCSHCRLDAFSQPQEMGCGFKLNCATAWSTKGQLWFFDVLCQASSIFCEKQALDRYQIPAFADCRNYCRAIADGTALPQRC